MTSVPHGVTYSTAAYYSVNTLVFTLHRCVVSTTPPLPPVSHLMLSDSLGQSWSPSPTQSSAQVLEEDGQQEQSQQESPGSEAIVFEKKWMVTDIGGEGVFLFLLRLVRPFLTLV